ncbi:MAG TPA: twitching motility protein PilT [Actinomycetota bacterium]|nr:twitching motility protein PilT [Actinomycetota bacterium]
MTRPAVVLDSGVIDQAVSNKEFRALLDNLMRGGWTPIIPAVVLAEAITGRPSDAPTNQVIGRLGTTSTDEPLARHAGALRYAAARDSGRRPPSGIDAIVAAHAADAGAGVVFTTDPGDLRRLLADQPHLRVEKP